MAELPWFPLYVERFLGSRKIRRMTSEQVGIYVLLLVEEWDDGPLADDDCELEFVGRVSAGRVREILRLCFELTEDGWINLALEDVRDEQMAKRERAAAAGRLGGLVTAKRRAKAAKADVKPDVKPDPGMSPDVQAVWSYWERKRKQVVGASGGPPMKMTRLRLSKIAGRLADGYTVAQLREAVDGCLGSSRNVSGGYVDIELICRSQSKVEQYRQWHSKGGPPEQEVDLAEAERRKSEEHQRHRHREEQDQRELEEKETNEWQQKYAKARAWFEKQNTESRADIEKRTRERAASMTGLTEPSPAIIQGMFMSIVETMIKEEG